MRVLVYPSQVRAGQSGVISICVVYMLPDPRFMREETTLHTHREILPVTTMPGSEGQVPTPNGRQLLWHIPGRTAAKADEITQILHSQ